MTNPPAPGTVKNLASLLQNVHVLVVDPDLAIAGIVRRVLLNLGFGKIFVEHTSKNGLLAFQRESIDFIITDFDMEKLDDEYSFVEFIRNSPLSPNPQVPIIMLTGHANTQDVEIARDLGITEFAAKPFTAKILCSRIIHVIENPRSFIITKRYSGPDRRRRAAEPPPGGTRRKAENTVKKKLHDKSQKKGSLFEKLLGKHA